MTTRRTKTKEPKTRNFVAKYARLVNKAGFHEPKKYNRKTKHKKKSSED